MKILLLSVLAGTLVGCATYSKEECQSMDWVQAGDSFARKGETLAGTKNHFREKCQVEYGVASDNQGLEQGFIFGLKDLCTPEGGERLARMGGTYKGTCEGKGEASFLSRYHTERERHLESEIRSLKSKISSLESDVSDLERKVRSAESKSCP